MGMLSIQILATFVCMYVSIHKQIYLPFVHFCLHAILGVDKLKPDGSLGKNSFIKRKQTQSPRTIILNAYKFKQLLSFGTLSPQTHLYSCDMAGVFSIAFK